MRAIRKFSLTLAATATLLLLAVALVSVGVSPSQQNPPASTLPGAQTGPGSTMSMPATPMALVAPLFIEDTASTSTITMVNSIPAPLDVDVILSDLHGNELARHTTTIGANAAQQVMVRSLLDEASYAGSAYGSAVLVPHRMFPLAAQMSIVRGIGVPNDIEEEFLMLMEELAPSNFRAVASDIAVAPVIAARSLSATKQPISLECMDDTGQRRISNLSIQPNETLLVQACLDGGAHPIPYLDDSTLMADAHHGSVAISVSSPAPPKELVVFGLGIRAKDPVRMRAMAFTDINALRSSTAIYPGVVAEGSLLGLQKPRLKLSIANFGNSPRNATFYLTTGSGDTSTEEPVATVNIPPGGVAVRNLDPEASSDDFTLDRSLVVQTDAPVGEVLSDVQLLSLSPDLPLSVPLPWKDQAQPYNGAQHPWRIDGPFSSTVLLFNPDPREANSVVLSIFAGDKRWNKLIPLPSLATTAVSLNDVVAKQEPDEKGRKLPRTSTSGIVSWFTLTNPKIFGQLVQANATERIARPFACPTATILCGATVDDLNLNVGQQNSTNAHSITCGTCAPCSCSLGGCNVLDGNPDGGLTANNVTWGAPNSPNASIAKIISSTVNNGIISAIFQGVSPGTTTSSVVLTDMYGCTAANNLNDTSQGQINVAPRIDSVSPSRGLIGATTSSVTITGQGFTGGHVNTPPAIQVSNITTFTDTQITFDAVISGTATTGNNAGAIYVTANSQDSNKKDFYVQVPTSLSVLSSQVVSMSSYCPNPANTYGILVAIHYQVLDQATVSIAPSANTMEPQEKITNLVFNGTNEGDPIPNWQDIGPSAYPGTSKFTDTNGQYWDAPLGFCEPTTFTASMTQSVSMLVGGMNYPIGGTARTNSWTAQSSASGKGSITNGTDVSQSH